jgi:hypothetical protein
MKSQGSRAGRLARAAVIVFLASLAVVAPQYVGASCVDPPEDGNWVNTDVNTRSITRIQLRFVCQDQVLNGKPYPPGAPWYVHIYGKCHPTDCDWGEVPAKRLGSGHIYATYNHGFARRYVYIKMSQYRPGQLWVYMWTDFTDPNRPDYGVQNWFRL